MTLAEYRAAAVVLQDLAAAATRAASCAKMVLRCDTAGERHHADAYIATALKTIRETEAVLTSQTE